MKAWPTRGGRGAAGIPSPTLAARFWAKVSPEPTSGCFLWTGSTTEGYGAIFVGITGHSDIRLAHHVAFFLETGRWPRTDDLAHKCDVRPCVRFDHLFEASRAENLADMRAKGRQARGNKLPYAKLTPEKVREIRASRDTPAELAKRYRVSRRAINLVRSRRNWSHV
jgi:hypothetical protein